MVNPLQNTDVVLTTYGMVQSGHKIFPAILHGIKWFRIVLGGYSITLFALN